MTEPKFNRIIAGCQWSSSWFVASAFLLVLLDVRLPEWLTGPFVVGIAVLAPLFLTVAMYQCWKLPDNRRLFAIPAILVLLGSGALMFSGVVEKDREAKTERAIEAVRESAAYMTAKDDYDAALQSYNILAARVFPPEFAKRFQENEDAKKAQWVVVESKSKALAGLESKVDPKGRTVFDLFGSEWAWVVVTVFVALYEVSNHMVAMALAYRAKEPAPKTETGETVQRAAKAEPFGVDEYIDWARKLGKDGLLAGYRVVSEATGQSTYKCRELFAEALATGKIKKRPGERNVREEQAS